MNKTFSHLVLIVVLGFAATSLMADPVIIGTSIFSASGTTQQGVPANATATVEVVGGQFKIVITNNIQVSSLNPYSVGSNISGFQLTVMTGGSTYTLSDFTLADSNADLIDFYLADGDDSASGVATAWIISSSGLTGVGGPEWPGQTILGQGPDYSTVNGSIDKNVPHNPLIAGSATFYLDLPAGITDPDAELTLSDAQFVFGTGPYELVPEPMSLLLVGSGLLGLGLLRSQQS